MLLTCLLGLCYFIAPVELDPATHVLAWSGDGRMYVKSCVFSQTLASIQCEGDPGVISRSGFE